MVTVEIWRVATDRGAGVVDIGVPKGSWGSALNREMWDGGVCLELLSEGMEKERRNRKSGGHGREGRNSDHRVSQAVSTYTAARRGEKKNDWCYRYYCETKGPK